MDDVSTPDDGAPATWAPRPPAAAEHPAATEAPATEAAPAADPEAVTHHDDATEDPPPHTGDPSVDDATAEVAATSGEPLETRLAAYERAHRTLQDRLADVEG